MHSRKQGERLDRQYKQTGQHDLKILWQRTRAICKRVFRQSKLDRFQKHVGDIKYGVQMETIYDKLRRLEGKPQRK